MSRLVPVALFLAAGVLAAVPDPQPEPGDIKRLVEKLGGEDYAEREAATKRLEDLGTTAIEELRAACKSENPEVARRARELFRKAERLLANEKTLAPTLVELDAKDKPLDDVLAELSKQAKCDVVLGGVNAGTLAGKKVTVSTAGKVPFWNAVLRVCDATDVQIAGVSGFYAPGSMPLLPGTATTESSRPSAVPPSGVRPMSEPNWPGDDRPLKIRRATSTQTAVVLESRDKPRRPAAVYGAVLIEAVPFPGATPAQPSALLQAWPEPRLQWQATTAVRVTRAIDAAGARLAAEGGNPPAAESRTTSDGFTIVRNPDGTAGLPGRGEGGRFPAGRAFTPNARQGLVRVKPDGTSATVAALGVSLFATVRSGIEPLSRAGDLAANTAADGVGIPGVDLTVVFRPDGKKFVAEVTLAYDPKAVHPAGVGDDLPGTKGGGAGLGNHTAYGVRVTDADGKPYLLGLSGGANQFDPTGKRVVMKLSLELHPDKNGHGPPSAVTFWGTHAKPVEVPVTLENVPLSGGK